MGPTVHDHRMALVARVFVVLLAVASMAVVQGAGRELAPGWGTSSPSRNSNAYARQQGSTGQPPASLAHTVHSSLSVASISSPRRELQGAASTSSAVERHKHLLPVSVQDVFLFILSFLTLALSAAAGIGECRPKLFVSPCTTVRCLCWVGFAASTVPCPPRS